MKSTMSFLVLAACLAAPAAAISSGPSPAFAPPRGATISGTVVDTNGNPVEGACVYLIGIIINRPHAGLLDQLDVAGLGVVTDANGAFQFTGVPRGNYVVAATKDSGGSTQSGSTNVTITRRNQTVNVTIVIS